MSDRKIVQVTVLRGDNYSCPAITDIGDPEFLYFIATPVTDPEVLAAHASRGWPRTSGSTDSLASTSPR